MNVPTRNTGMSHSQSKLRTAPRVAVIGGHSADTEALSSAEEMGRLIARHGYLLVTGGRGGVMEAASMGAKSAGGTVLGILPGSSRSEANPFVDIVVTTGLGHLRNALVVGNADIVVAVDGAYGTLSEIAHANIAGIPVLGLGTWQIPGVLPMDSPQQVIQYIRKHLEA